jgi:hypothetical protein
MSGLTQEQVAALVGVLTTGVPQDEVVVQHQGTLQRPADTLALLASRFADGDEGEGIGPHSGLARGVSHASQLAAHLLALPAVEQRPEERGRNQQQQLETAALLSQLLTSSRTAAPAALAAAVQAAAAVPAGHPDVTSPQPQQQQQREEQHLQMPKLAAAVMGDDAMAGDGGDAMDEDAGSRGGGAAANHTPAADPQQQQLLHPQSAAAAAALQVRGSKSLSVRQQLGLPPVGLGVSAAAQPPTTAMQTKPRPPHSHVRCHDCVHPLCTVPALVLSPCVMAAHIPPFPAVLLMRPCCQRLPVLASLPPVCSPAWPHSLSLHHCLPVSRWLPPPCSTWCSCGMLRDACCYCTA